MSRTRRYPRPRRDDVTRTRQPRPALRRQNTRRGAVLAALREA